jgi:phosphopantothenoylcysteine decarboxylase
MLVLSYLGQTSFLRALAPTTPTYVFPAMNTFMYEHPLTDEHLRIVKEVIGYTVVGPIGKTLACGDAGKLLVAASAIVPA